LRPCVDPRKNSMENGHSLTGQACPKDCAISPVLVRKADAVANRSESMAKHMWLAVLMAIMALGGLPSVIATEQGGWRRGSVAIAAEGALDLTFNAGGRIVTDMGGYDQVRAVVVQPDGRIVAIGDSNLDFALVSYTDDGRIDPGFGIDGRVVTAMGGHARACVAAVQSDGKIVVGGGSGQTSSDFAVVRYNSDGTLDHGFGVGGKVITALGGDAQIRSLVIQPDGKIVAGGNANFDFALVRYNGDGSLDPGFGSGGTIITDLGGWDTASAVIFQPDGKIVVAGTSDGNSALVRYTGDGRLDDRFGAGGKVIIDLGIDDKIWALALQADGKIVAAGSIGYPGDFIVARYTGDGRLDAGFGTGGQVRTDMGGRDRAFFLAAQLDGTIMAAGTSGENMALVQYTGDGRPDPGFGVGGKVVCESDAVQRSISALTLQADGRMVAAGGSQEGDFFLARYDRKSPVILSRAK